ncbi:hypothetical protein HO173_004434 [Letharia columbiana]|uniref:Uncharacterized protein n=1 Tax=Letharia columbiana TaxID=112416 RepID=A0A8H6L6K3_9LECA|nr:uncharacterized protein HO173_004434 [Letharia columbiana]KAF6237544.1 hypothetical protein HO173_004434 [Letharia columbiana]
MHILSTLGSLATFALSTPAQPLAIRQDDPSSACTEQCVQYGDYVRGTSDSCSGGSSDRGGGGYGTQPTPNPSDPGNPGPTSNSPDNGTDGRDGGDGGGGD